MTVNVLYTVWCDGKRDDGENDCGNWIAADTAWEARDEARAAGWTCGKRLNSRDLCPEHVTASQTDRQPQPDPTAPSAQSRADKIAAAIVPDQLDQYLGAGECDLHEVCRDGKRQCPYHQALAAGPSSPTTFRPEGT